ncbi:hypothetical protein K402DRAFT_321703 [Aulographum hederae CBS 113979]|uniref:CST complex subunit Stn1 N-terminal domain-containing protein n=1 Tax=Aulographum hederae CBS 113979 TaxID=1176131 RepID=A0A6G1HEZ3_9PEZI|nr:hypothetical protein K402DRAFT_321703 [Aulographum hederae CBS 113979]
MNQKDTAPPPIYPACYFRASPTYDAWVKVSAADVHALREEPGFKGQNLYFHLNYPIRYIRLVGLVVAITFISKYVFLELDDGSGRTIEAKITRLPETIASSIDCPSNTEVDNVNLLTGIGYEDVEIDGEIIDIGTVLTARCSLDTFRGVRQAVLQRVSIVKSTEEEARAWEQLAKFRRDVLAKPWVLSEAAMASFDRQLRDEEKKGKKEKVVMDEHEKKKEKKRRKYQAVLAEYERQQEARFELERAKLDAGALDARQ